MIDKKREHEHGITLIELMIVLVIAAILVGGIYTLFTTQQRSYSVQDQVTGVQQDARAAITIIARDIRMAGLLIGSEGFNVNGALFAITPNNPGGTDSIKVAYGADEFTSGGNPVTVTTITGQDVYLSADPSGFFGSGTDPDRFVAFEGDNAVYEIQSINTAGTDSLTLTESPPVYLANVGARVFRAKSIAYQVQNGELQRVENNSTTQPMIGDGTTTVVEDLQFAYQIEGDTSWYNGSSEFPTGNSEADIRMVRINIIVRTAVPDPEETSFFKPACEDNPQSNTDTGCRRRVYTTVVKARNL